MYRYLGLLAAAAVLALGALLLGTHIGPQGGANSLHMHPVSASDSAIAPPQLILLDPPGQNRYQAHSAGVPVVAGDGRPVAQLSHAPTNLQEVTAEMPPVVAVNPSVIAYQVLSSIRYQGNGHTVYVTTARPSAAANPPGATLQLGNQSFKLPDGSTGWVMADTQAVAPNEIRWEKNGLIITVAGDLSIDELRALAAAVTLTG